MINIVRAINLNNAYPVPFKAGITTLYFDFDGTFMPLSHNEVCSNDELRKNEYRKRDVNILFTRISDFLRKTQDKFKFIITTGRNKDEFEFFDRKAREKGIYYPHPDKLITRDGAAVIKHYAQLAGTTEVIKYDEIAEQIMKHQPDQAYSNARIEKIVKSAATSATKLDKKLSHSDLLDAFKNSEPDITKEDLELFAQNMKLLK